MSGRLAGKVVAITGGESGIGRAIALRAAQEGALVAVGGLDATGLDETVASMSNMEGDGLAVQTDVTQRDQVDAFFAAAVEKYGRLDAAIANAGAFVDGTDFTDIAIEDWSRVMAVNLTGVFHTLQSAAKVLIDQGEGGSLMATGSSTALRPAMRILPYVASKGGVHQMMRALAVELAEHNIRVNTIVPGMANTQATAAPGYREAGIQAVPMNAIIEPDEVAALVAFALSDEAPHMTGTLLKVDGGRTSA